MGVRKEKGGRKARSGNRSPQEANHVQRKEGGGERGVGFWGRGKVSEKTKTCSAQKGKKEVIDHRGSPAIFKTRKDNTVRGGSEGNYTVGIKLSGQKRHCVRNRYLRRKQARLPVPEGEGSS